ncbi:MAG: alkaline phosphatase family protein [Clostridiales bacterium]|jgi:predicted AlkP superfamily pyrophosphatase or phosphodiesterase|nr:alkaline phosphatase family protein [Clostridiales bacterium]
MKKIIKTILIALIVVGVVVGGYFAVPTGIEAAKYADSITKSGLFKNTMSDRLPQTAIYGVMYKHFYDNQSGKTPMLLFVGYDGFRADAAVASVKLDDSGIADIIGDGEIYLGKAGNILPWKYQQTVTASGWTSEFTGLYSDKHKVRGNGMTMSGDAETIMHRLARDGFSASFSASWPHHFDTVYKNELEDSVSNGYPISYYECGDDGATRQAMLLSIAASDRAVFGIFEYTDAAGHNFDYELDSPEYFKAVVDAERDGAELVAAVKARENYANEDWLIIITTDHGGYNSDHGGFNIKETTIFFAVNKKGLF